MRPGLLISLIALGATMAGFAARSGATGDVTRAKFLGAWRLVSVETIRSNGEMIYPYYGKSPKGILMYDPSGSMSVEIVSDPQPSVPTANSRESFLAAFPADKVVAINGYYAYGGTWNIDVSKSMVTQHIVQSLYPAGRGESGVRTLFWRATGSA